jgi:hypothetical protein
MIDASKPEIASMKILNSEKEKRKKIKKQLFGNALQLRP